jgi:hypothetical protein
MNHRHMTDDHHGRTAGRATLLVRAADEILGTHRCIAAVVWRASLPTVTGQEPSRRTAA